MLDYQRIVDDVRSALFNNGQDGEDFLQAAAADYFLAVDEINERLKTCGTLLRKGLRSEAIQICELDPNLLDAVAQLDFPERDSWRQLLSSHGLAMPAALLLDIAADLNEAYAAEQPLAALLQRHRLLAMSNAPLRLRLETLRKLAHADPERLFWQEDVRMLEEERLKEIQREVSQAIGAGDVGGVNALAIELEGGPWQAELPSALLTQVASARADFAKQQGKAALQLAGEQLSEAFAAGDVAAASDRRDQWNYLYGLWGSSADPGLLECVERALEWLRQQEESARREAQHAMAVSALDQAIAAHRPAAELEHLYQDAEQSGGVSPTVDNRYRGLLAQLRRETRVRICAMASLVALVLSIGVGIVLMMARGYQHQRAVEEAARSLEALMRDGKLDETGSFLDQLATESPSLAEDPIIQEYEARRKKQVAEAESRLLAYTQAIEMVRQSIEKNAPDREPLNRASTLAITEEEKAVVRGLDAQIAKFQQTAQAKMDQEFLAKVRDLRERSALIEKEAEDAPDTYISKLKMLGGDLRSLEEANPQIGEAASKSAAALRNHVKSISERALENKDRLNQEEVIAEACGNPPQFRDRLLAYATKYPGERRAARFQQAVSEAPLWEWLNSWNDMVRGLRRQSSQKLGRKEAGEAAAKLQKLLESRSGHPDTKVFQQRLAFLQAIAQRVDEEGNPIEASLKVLFADPLVAGVWMLTDDAGSRYYLLEDPAARLGDLQGDKMYGFEYVVGFDMTKKRTTFRGSQVANSNVGTAPQRRIARSVTSLLDGLSDDNWEPSFCRILDVILADAETDPLLRLLLFQKTLAVGCRGSLCLEQALGRHKELLKISRVPLGVNWMDPKNSEGTESRRVAATELANLPSLADARQTAAKLWRATFASVGTEYRWIGWLRHRGSLWECVKQAGIHGTGGLFIVRSEGNADDKHPGAILEPIGRLKSGRVELDAPNGNALLEGRPVYLAVPAGQ